MYSVQKQLLRILKIYSRTATTRNPISSCVHSQDMIFFYFNHVHQVAYLSCSCAYFILICAQ